MDDERQLTMEIARRSKEGDRSERDAIAVEEPLEIRLNGETLALTMRTPGDDEALAAGFLITEGIIRSRNDIWDIRRCGDPRNPDVLNVVEVVIPDSLIAEDDRRIAGGRQRYASSACGICGRGSIESVRAIAPGFDSVPTLAHDLIVSLPEKLRAAQAVFDRTGGLHAAGLFNAEGTLLYHAEDIGRHNAVDKVFGKSILSDRPDRSALILMVSGRAGFEILQKSLVARIPVVCSVSAPSSLAVQLAAESGMALIGFLRANSFNVYAGGESIVG